MTMMEWYRFQVRRRRKLRFKEEAVVHNIMAVKGNVKASIRTLRNVQSYLRKTFPGFVNKNGGMKL